MNSGRRLTVHVNVYDLTPNNQYLHPVGFGAYHSGVEVGGVEYTFAGGAGIFSMTPKDAPGAVYRETIEMGTIEGPAALARAIEALKADFGPNDYNILSRNCNTFTQRLIKELLGKDIPGYLNRLAFFGSFFSCFMPKDMTAEAPVNDPNGGGGYPTRQYIGGGGNYTAFGGSGQTLSSSSSGGGGGGGGRAQGAESEKEKQGRIREARLARIAGQSTGR